ncbi:MAG TPA: NRDE family protein [Spongiibacteraceae bacterium]|nr:NRDE family protein [Spongiibacteraceae bacterium]
MCLIVFAIDSHPRYPFVLAANRDEFYARPTRSLHAWPDAPQVYAGRDLEAGGTWLGITRHRRFAAITNVREGVHRTSTQRSRGELTRDFLLGTQSAASYAEQVYGDGDHYAGFNLLLGDGADIYYCSNRGETPRALTRGIYGLSNDSLDTPWPKVVGGKAELRKLLESEPSTAALLRILADTHRPDDSELPDTGVGLDLERKYSSRFIASDEYGTRASTALLIDSRGDVEICEQNFGGHGAPIDTLIVHRWSDRQS